MDNGSSFPVWQTKKIEDVLKIASGRDCRHLGEGAIPVFGTGGLMTKVDSFLHDGETVCIGRKGTIDKPMYYKGKIWTVDTLFFTHSFTDVLPKFLFYAFQSINWKEHNEASGVPSLSKNTIKKISFKIPSEKEQRYVVAALDSISQKNEIEKGILTLYQRQQKYFLDNLFI
ncbi:restriction endonuclease subunit S [Sediminibacterium ginsengisoli]|uniref:Type I restriction modification DNA specificity domain-containing protein n=1 Tax=Sediminibacterium ginsengisoli TaxID=413434 RepID=A0A1T4RJU5_9BACT|nr:restriction endonuclease subunit S [Sediminibacterium ginsengisoli]SKA16290.1 Type I restriction modification DNA specificity domain-containing protein [Sediminibacterium ginsengisoli]